MRFKTSDGYILERTVRRTYPRLLWTDRDLTFQDRLGWPVDDAGEKLDGEFLPETPGEAARQRIDSVLNILEDWDDWTTDMGGDEEEDGREDLARIRRMKCHLRRALKGLEIFR
jgi:hypothetical protein